MKLKTLAPLALCTASLVVLADGSDTLAVKAGATEVISNTTSLSQLTIGEGAKLSAAQGYSLTLTVNGVSTAIKPGTYKGKVVLTPTEDVTVKFNDMGLNDTYNIRSALYVDNGKIVPSKSVQSALVGGTVTATAAKDVTITSNEDKFNGFFITGNSKYSIDNVKINFTGNGGNDFVGFGSAIKTAGTAQVTINNAKIKNTGVVRTAVFVGGDSVVNVNNSDIEVYNGTLPADYQGGPITGMGGVMMEPPWVMGIKGNVRATNVVENGEVHYNNSRIKSQGWGVLSTDATRNVKLFCKDSQVEAIESGYGAYADGVSTDTFSGCTIKSPDYGIIVTGGNAHLTDKTVINAGRMAVMTHSSGSGKISFEKGSVLNAKEAVIQIKSSYNHIVVNNAQLNSDSGVILEAVVNDDPFAGAGMGAGAAGMGGAAPGGGAPGGAPGGAMPGGAGGPPGGGAAGGGMAATTSETRSIIAEFSNTTLNGDIINSMTSLAGMKVTLENATLTGGISTSTATAAGKPAADNLKVVGKFNQAFGAVTGNNGLELTLGKNANWVVSKSSYLTGLTIAEGASIAAPKGYVVKLTVDGKDTPVRAGAYKGAIVLNLSKG